MIGATVGGLRSLPIAPPGKPAVEKGSRPHLHQLPLSVILSRMSSTVFVAVDMGASSGRHVAGLFDGQRLALEEVHRFENGPVVAAGRLVLGPAPAVGARSARAAGRGGQLWRSHRRASASIRGASISACSAAATNCSAIRITTATAHRRHARARRSRSCRGKRSLPQPGLQFMEFNTLYQLLAMKLAESPLLDVAESLLMMPDLFHWLLTGVKANEFTDATTTQFFNPADRRLGDRSARTIRLPDANSRARSCRRARRSARCVRPWPTRPAWPSVEVVLPGTHDTASAVMAVPAASKPGKPPDWCYISSGTWSLMGVETPRRSSTTKCLALNFTNEGGVGGTTRLLKNIAGLWLVQECRRIWKQAGRELFLGRI